MSVCYQVILKPSDVKFTCSKIPANFDDGVSLESVLADVRNGSKDVSDVGVIEVAWYADKWEWYTLNNQLLWIFSELEKTGDLSHVSMQRVEYMEEDDDTQELPSTLFDSADLAEVQNGRIRSRSASVCSSSSEGRGKDDWGRRGTRSYAKSRSVSKEKTAYLSKNNKFLDENASCESKKSSMLDWVQGRKKFCQLYSRDYNFQEYVAQNVITESELSLQPSSSLFSLASNADSVFSSSTITREQRQIDPLSGYHGYGHYDDYNTQYLSKLREERLKARRKLKPYDVGCSRLSKTRSRRSSFSSQDDDGLDFPVKKSFVIKEERITRTYSESFDYRRLGRHRERERRNSTSPSRRSSLHDMDTRRRIIRRGRSYSEGERCRERSRSSHVSRTERRVSHTCVTRSSLRRSSSGLRSKCYPSPSRRSSHGSSSSLQRYGSSKRSSTTLSRSSLHGSCSSLRSNGGSYALRLSSAPKDKLYEIWQRRREAYLQARYEFKDPNNNSLALTGYTCGLCFKSFKTRVRREQHSDELLHWACITCGRFFASHTALGQHVEQAGHRKD